jgi:hypothetical protein
MAITKRDLKSVPRWLLLKGLEEPKALVKPLDEFFDMSLKRRDEKRSSE